MNTFQNLIDNGIEPHTAQDMLDGYSKRIGTMNGVYEITDITYDFTERGKDVTLKCSLCSREIHRMMISGRNKWSELIKSCPCQKTEKARIDKEEFEKSKKIKKDKIQSDGVSMIGSFCGDYKIIGFEFLKDVPIFTLECTKCRDITTANYQRVKNNAKTYSKCHKHGNTVKYDESYIGMKKNFLTVKEIARFPKSGHRAFLCECDCGNRKLIEPVHWERGIVKSCGCKRSELLSEILSKENPVNGIRIYRVYMGMKSRCYNPNSDSYRNYGARGISVCDEWLNDFWKFYEWAYANGYDENAEWGECTIERKDVNGNYEPSNCEWITIQQQQRNKRTNVFITMNGETKILTDWHNETGMSLYNLKKIANGENIRKEKWDKFIRFRLTKQEKKELEETASSLGITVSEYVRDLIIKDVEKKEINT